MKLIYCTECQDIVMLVGMVARYCACKKSWGLYTDHLRAQTGGPSIPIGIANNSFVAALKARPMTGPVGSRFEAFVIPMQCDTVKEGVE